MVYSSRALYEGGGGAYEYGKSGHLSILTPLKHLMMLLKCKVFRVSFLHRQHAAQTPLWLRVFVIAARFACLTESVTDPEGEQRGCAPLKFDSLWFFLIILFYLSLFVSECLKIRLR